MIKTLQHFRLVIGVENLLRRAGAWRRFLPWSMVFGVPQLLRGQNHVDYRFESYNENNDRMMIITHSLYTEQKLADNVTARASLTYDGVSGATPIGTHDSNGHAVLKKIDSDIRDAVDVELETKLGRNTFTPGFAYSKEHDYESYGISLNDAIDFNDKNTVVSFGVAEDLDSVRHKDRITWSPKFSTDAILGVSQILGPNTILNAAFTLGYESGYLDDPYRLAQYIPNNIPGWNPTFFVGAPEHRPDHKTKEVLLTSLTHHFDSLDASLEASYRFYHDSYGVFGHTLELTWHQWLGKHLILEPLFRIYEQSAANFYANTFSLPLSADPAGIHSSDYRLSEFYSLDYGLQGTVLITDNLRITAGYHRYEMRGLDKTTQDMYPQANVYTIGFSVLW